MRFGSFRFVPKLWAAVLFMAVLSCMLLLANWQLQRAALKVELQAAAERAQVGPAAPLPDMFSIESDAAQYRRVALRGHYIPDQQFLWDNRTHKGQAGYEVISVLRLEDRRLVLINRGWVAPGTSRQDLPDVSLPDGALAAVVQIEGYLSRPSKGFASGNAVTGNDNWPKLLQYFDYQAISDELEESVVPVVVQPQSLGTDAATSTVLTSRPEWLIANWQPAASGPAKHYSYAFQWFAMSIALTALFLVVNSHKIRPPDHENNLPQS